MDRTKGRQVQTKSKDGSPDRAAEQCTSAQKRWQHPAYEKRRQKDAQKEDQQCDSDQSSNLRHPLRHAIGQHETHHNRCCEAEQEEYACEDAFHYAAECHEWPFDLSFGCSIVRLPVYAAIYSFPMGIHPESQNPAIFFLCL
jgi:hypothetical protein